MTPATVTTTLPFAIAPTRRGPRNLFADLIAPAGDASADLIVWMHSGGFRTGTRKSRHHPAIAAAFAAEGYKTAFIDYRLARPHPILSPDAEAALPTLEADARAAAVDMDATFYGFRALAAVEDCCAFLRYADARREELGLSGRYILAGSSAGAISAINTLYLAEALGQKRPPVATVFSFSGGFAYPTFLHATGARILAIHSPLDARVPISSIRRLVAETPDICLLLEDEANGHGNPCLTPDEPLDTAIARCAAFDRTALPPT
jgi:acetyl esterase/lipase